MLMRVLITAACAPPGRNTYLAVKELLGSNNVLAADADFHTLKTVYKGTQFIGLPSAHSCSYLDATLCACKSNQIDNKNFQIVH